MIERPFICGFLKVRNEIVREGNVYRVLKNIEQVADSGVLCDDASTDGTREHLRAFVKDRPKWRLIEVPAEAQDFRRELYWKQKMLDVVHEIKPEWVLWMDGDEVFDADGTKRLREWLREQGDRQKCVRAWAFHYTQLWRKSAWARIDEGFDDGRFIKLWRYGEDLRFDVVDKTHALQVPPQVLGAVGGTPFEQVHYGNYGKNITWKCIQYHGGLGGVERHLRFGQAEYRPVPASLIPEGCEYRADSVKPVAFTDKEAARILDMENLRQRRGYFAVVVPSYNRASTLPRALDSLLEQTYEKWIALVLDDGSTDDTQVVMREYQDKDPRIFYARYLENRGGVAMNEIGMAMAVEMTEFWTRLGSDDWFAPRKLEFDAAALRHHEAVYGPYQVHRSGSLDEMCGKVVPAERLRADMAERHVFAASWANCAARTSLLARVREVYGAFCDPRLRNMEDYLFNVRAARVSKTGWVWRGLVDGKFIVNPQDEIALHRAAADAFWNVNPVGASSNGSQTGRDNEVTLRILSEERGRSIAPPAVVVADSVPERSGVGGETEDYEHLEMFATVESALDDGLGVDDATIRSWECAASYPPDKEIAYPRHAYIQEFDSHVGKKVLDYGCGCGTDTISYQRRNCDVWYADIVPKCVETTKQRTGGRGHAIFLRVSGPLPLNDGSIDVVNAHGVLHHIKDAAAVAKEFYRVLAPGGFAYVMLITEKQWERCLRQINDGVSQRRFGGDQYAIFSNLVQEGTRYTKPYTDAEGRALLEGAGLKVEAVTTWCDDIFRTYKAVKS